MKDKVAIDEIDFRTYIGGQVMWNRYDHRDSLVGIIEEIEANSETLVIQCYGLIHTEDGIRWFEDEIRDGELVINLNSSYVTNCSCDGIDTLEGENSDVFLYHQDCPVQPLHQTWISTVRSDDLDD